MKNFLVSFSDKTLSAKACRRVFEILLLLDKISNIKVKFKEIDN
jgi:hypothetical protein